MSVTLTPDYLSGEGGLDRIYDAIEAILPGVQHPIVQMELWNAIEDFCTRTTSWRLNVGWAMAGGVNTVNLSPLDDAVAVAHVLELHGFLRIRVRPPATLIDPGDTRLARAGSVTVAAKPRRLAEEIVPAFLADEWSEELRDGTLYRLFMHPFKPYTSPQLAGLYSKKWRYALSRATAQAKQQACRPHFPYFAWGRQGGGWPGGGCVVGPLDYGPGISPPPVIIPPSVSIGPGILSRDALLAPTLLVGPGVLAADAIPQASVTSTTVTFDPATVGANENTTVRITNDGNSPLIITALTTTGDFSVTGAA